MNYSGLGSFMQKLKDDKLNDQKGIHEHSTANGQIKRNSRAYNTGLEIESNGQMTYRDNNINSKNPRTDSPQFRINLQNSQNYLNNYNEQSDSINSPELGRYNEVSFKGSGFAISRKRNSKEPVRSPGQSNFSIKQAHNTQNNENNGGVYNHNSKGSKG